MRKLILVLGGFIYLFSIGVSAQTNELETLRSTADELNPIMSKDGRTLYFIRKFHAENTAGMKDPGDIWVSQYTDSMQWSTPVRMASQLNNTQFNGVIGILEDGNKVYLYQHYMPGGGVARTQGISYSILAGSKWSTPGRVDVKYFYNRSEHISISLSADGNVMLLALESYGTLGAEDLYVSFRMGTDIWSEPKNLGDDVNTSLQEMTPYLAPDNKTLFFASNGHGGFGGRDIFVSQRQDDTWQTWSAPQNLGKSINTEGVELYFQYYPNEEKAVYTSTQNSDGYSDLRLAFFPKEALEEIIGDSIEIPAMLPGPVIGEIRENIPEPDSEFHVSGNVLDASTNGPLKANLSVSKQGFMERIVVSDKGQYQITIPTSGVYEIIVESEGYVSKQELLDVRISATGTIQHDFVLEPIAVGTTVTLDNVLFVRGSTELLESSNSQLDLVVKMMLENPKMEIELAGHTDNQGSERLNRVLSQQRVDEVIAYISQHGISKTRLDGRGYGGSVPIASNEVEETRRLNRRVEFTIVKN